MKSFRDKQGMTLLAVTAVAFFMAMFGIPGLVSVKYSPAGVYGAAEAKPAAEEEEPEPPEPPKVAHLAPPESVKAVYMTGWVAGTPSLRDKVLKLIDETEINAVVIDIKDDTGRISFKVADPKLAEEGSEEVRVRELRELIAKLHEKGVYVIGRIASFQDPYMVKRHPERAVKRKDGTVWGDRKGLTWIDPGSREHWDYLVRIGRESFEAGFDELNYDYVRFPTDGNMGNLAYPISEGKEKPAVLKEFFAHLDRELKDAESYSEAQDGKVPAVSADLFGMVTTSGDDMGIGQLLENALPHFDYIAPMVYPSHYPPHFNGWKDPNAVPYEIVKFAMDSAVERQKAFREKVASTTPDAPYLSRLEPDQFRPWLQDNDYPVPYTPAMVRAQIKATYDAGLDSWMLWDAGNTYTRAALLDE